jgi:sigma-B regulation protein RsbU (phosphoserine phosphatase)
MDTKSTIWPLIGAAVVAGTLVASSAWWGVAHLQDQTKRDTGNALTTVLESTSEAAKQWFRQQEQEASIWAAHPEVVNGARQLLRVGDSPTALSRHPAQALFSEQLQLVVQQRGYDGYLIISPTGRVLSSTDASEVASGGVDVTAQFLNSIVRGPRYVAVSLPGGQSEESLSDTGDEASMLVGAAIRDPSGAVVGVLAFRIDPEREFTEILQRGRIGESGESYAFNRTGQLISESRFDDQLRAIGLIGEDERGILNIGVRDPGGNMVRGYRPADELGDQPLTEMAASAISGHPGVNVDGYNDYRGVPVIGAWTWDEVLGMGVTTEIDVAEAYTSFYDTRRLAITAAVLTIGLIFALTAMFLWNRKQMAKVQSDLEAMVAQVQEKARALAKANEELNRQSAALEAAADSIVITDTDGTIRWVNPAFSKLTGYSSDEALGENPRVLKSGMHDPPFYKHMWDTINSGQVWNGEVVNRRKDGSLWTEEMSITPVRNEQGQIVDFVAIKRDITDRKVMEAELERARHRMEEELNVGRDIQMGMLPLIFPPYPRRHEFSVHAALKPAREVGGDFYDFYLPDEDRLCFVVGDVSGKGVPAALFMAVTKTLIESRARNDSSPASILTHVNNELSRHNEASMFVTVFMGILDVRTGELSYSNAGHNPPYIKREDGSLVRLDQRHGPVIGAMEDMVYGEDNTRLNMNDRVFVYTDGVTEAMNLAGELYSEARLVDLLSSEKCELVESMVTETVSDVACFEGEAEQADDVTVLAIQFFGGREQEEGRIFELSVTNRLDEIDRLNEAFNVFAEQNAVPTAGRRSTNLVFDELLNNVISYAFGDEADHTIDVTVEQNESRLLITISDDGKPFNPFQTDPPDTALSIADRGMGGLGVHLVRNMMDEVSYNRRTDRNVVTLVKYLAAQSDTRDA